TVRVIEMRSSGMDLAAGQALQRCRTVGREPVDPQARMPALGAARPQRQGWRASGDDYRVRERVNVLQETCWHPGLPRLQTAFGTSREQLRPQRLVAAQRMCNPALPDTGEQET